MGLGDVCPRQIFGDVKAYLDITWMDEHTDHRLEMMIGSGIAYLQSKLGSAVSFEADGLPRTLLFEYVRYMRDSALDVFEANYQSLLVAAINEIKVAQNVEETSSPEE